jgi:hypothetical protein
MEDLHDYRNRVPVTYHKAEAPRLITAIPDKLLFLFSAYGVISNAEDWVEAAAVTDETITTPLDLPVVRLAQLTCLLRHRQDGGKIWRDARRQASDLLGVDWS